MKHLEFKTTINAPAAMVWNTMLSPASYKAWTKNAWPGSYFIGDWGKDEEIKFVGEEGGGTTATIEEFQEYKTILAKHIGVILKDGTVEKNDEIAKDWVGTMERYTFLEENGKTIVQIDIDTPPSWAEMFEEGWSIALNDLKLLTEQAVTQV